VRSDNQPPADGDPADVDWLFVPGSLMKTNYGRWYWVPSSS
jgi:hypothetical protein